MYRFISVVVVIKGVWQMTIVFGVLCFIAGINVGCLMAICVSNVMEKRENK